MNNQKQIIEIYRNLRKKCWSIRYKGKVIQHLKELTLENVEFKVSEAGRQRVLKEKRKNVHAYAKGNILDTRAYLDLANKQITYNPYIKNTFYFLENCNPVLEAKYVVFKENGTVFVS